MPRRRVLYVTTREVTYPRNETLIRAFGTYADVDVIAPRGNGQGFDRRLRYVWGVGSVVLKAITPALSPRGRYDALVLGFLAQPLAVVLRPFWRGHLIADAMISVYDTLCWDKQLASPDSLRGRIARWLDSNLVRHCDALIFDTDQHRKYFQTFTTGDLPTSCVVPVGARTLTHPPSPPPQSDRFLAVFAGSYIPLQGARVIVEAAQLLHDDPIDFVMIGAGQEHAAVTEFAAKSNLRNVRFVGWADTDELDRWYHRADVVLGIFGRTEKTQRVIPNKVFEALSIGRPVITGDTPAIRELFVPGRDLIGCPVDNPPALADAIRRAIAHREPLREIGAAGQRAFHKHACGDALAAAVRPLLGMPHTGETL